MVDSSCFDINLEHETNQTKLHEAVLIFETITTNRSPLYRHKKIILFLNKQDLLLKKIMTGQKKLEGSSKVFFRDF